jgi:phosphopantetheinyl transferase (holo-ACP synthase)
MVGNDIVDLKLALSDDKASNQRWLNKVFLEREIELILSSENPNIMLWRLWSMKESAYKVAVKKSGIRAFNPKRFETLILGPSQGRVNSIFGTFYAKTWITEDYIHSIASDFFDKMAVSGQKKTDTEDLSADVRIGLLEDFRNNKPQFSELNIVMAAEIPLLYSGADKLPFDISLSHHGNFVGWGYQRI